jgi:hypothetical protein
VCSQVAAMVAIGISPTATLADGAGWRSAIHDEMVPTRLTCIPGVRIDDGHDHAHLLMRRSVHAGWQREVAISEATSWDPARRSARPWILRALAANHRNSGAPGAEQPATLARMHGSAWRGDGAKAARARRIAGETRHHAAWGVRPRFPGPTNFHAGSHGRTLGCLKAQRPWPLPEHPSKDRQYAGRKPNNKPRHRASMCTSRWRRSTPWDR